jgi:hypothetical protein
MYLNVVLEYEFAIFNIVGRVVTICICKSDSDVYHCQT